jgi:hypothetical protein
MDREPMKRQALYDLIWSVPVSRLAPLFDLSDRGLSKYCRRANIPVPPRGYWAKLAAGQRVERAPLPPTGPNGQEWAWIAPPGSTYGEEGREWLEREVPGWGGSEPNPDAPPTPPEFDFDMHILAYDTLNKLGSTRVRAPELRSSLHPEIQRLLDRDKAARENWFRGGVAAFRGKSSRRRLAFLNAFLLGVQRLGGDGKLDEDAREVEVSLNRRRICCTLHTRLRKPKRGAERQEVLVFKIAPRSAHADRFRFEDDRTGRLEECLRLICWGVALVVELERRADRGEDYRYRMQLFEDEQRKAQQRRTEAREAARARLVSQARAHRDADDIRRFVAEARRTKSAGCMEFAVWQQWALAQADAIDPLAGASFDLSVPLEPPWGSIGVARAAK